jgi:putative cardiolipin synthase
MLDRLFAGAAVIASTLVQGCAAALPSLDDRAASAAIQDTTDTRLGSAIVPLVAAHPGTSGVFALPDGRDAFAARMRLADAAERSLDVQYYIWRQDLSGTLLFDALRRAADRGVRVRLLLDDNNTVGLDEILAALDAHPNVEVRLFNPFTTRRWREIGWITDFARLNRRMHNKSFTADNQATVIGGRNVGDEYFDAGAALPFIDLDVLAIGPVVRDVTGDFDRYWASGSSYPADRILPAVDPQRIAALAADAAAAPHGAAAIAYSQAVVASQFVQEMMARRLPFEWADVHLVSDDPAKGLGLAADDELLWSRLKRTTAKPERRLQLVSPYFVPGAEGVRSFAALSAAGVKVSVLTNSLAATDVPAVHAGYAKRRKALLEAGVGLFELKRTASTRSADRLVATGGSSDASLHAKTFAIDDERVFVGSFNFDPRSARLNTEMGFVIDSSVLARSIADWFRMRLPDHAYRVQLGPAGELQWIERVDGREIVHEHEPDAGWWKRMAVSILSWLPIESLL